jgi:Flp pilus assembly pilin Flp
LASAAELNSGTVYAILENETRGQEMFKFIKNFKEDERGAAMVEYAIALLVAAGVGIATFSAMGDQAGINATAACDVLTNGETLNASC